MVGDEEMTIPPPYLAYHDAGIPWIKSLPSHWEVKPLFAIFRERAVKNQGNKITKVLSLSYGNIIVRNVENNLGLLPESFETYQIVEPGNIILRLTDLQNDKVSLRVGLVKELGIITSAYVCLSGNKEINEYFAYLLLHAYDLLKVFYTFGGGVRQTMRFEDLKHFPIPLPPLPEQEAIASYLDLATARIDALIAKKKRLLELLAEKRAALITRAVTQGLDPNAELKDSGAEWLGKIPKHWEVKRLKYISQINPSLGNDNGISSECEVTFLPMELIGKGKINTEVTKKYSEVKQGFTYFSEGDVIVAKITPCFENGKGAIAVGLNNRVGFGTTELHVIRPRNKKQTQFIYLITKSTHFMNYGESMMIGTAGQKRVPNDFVEDFPISIPPNNEMGNIVEFVTRKLEHISGSEEKTASAILLLQEYRSSLISAAVTGQIDVRKLN
jgi:type I restriction enzyme, S subunit